MGSTGRRSAALAAIALAAAPAAAGTGWTAIGATKLDGPAASAALRWRTEFRELLVCADGGAVKLAGATLRFKDGGTRPLKLRARLANGACLPEIAVQKGREVEAIDFSIDPAGGPGGGTSLTLAAR